MCYPSANREARNPKQNRYTFIIFQNDNHTQAKAHILYISLWIALEMLSTIREYFAYTLLITLHPVRVSCPAGIIQTRGHLKSIIIFFKVPTTLGD